MIIFQKKNDKSLLFIIPFVLLSFSNLFAQLPNQDDNFNGGPSQVPINENIYFVILLTIFLVFVYFFKSNKAISNNSNK